MRKPTKSEGATIVADEKKMVSAQEALHALYKSVKERVTEFEQKCVELRKAELAKPGYGDGGYADPSSEKGHSAKLAMGEEDERLERFAKNMDLATPMAMNEMCKACGMSRGGSDHDCDVVEKYAKGEYMPAGAAPEAPGKKEGVLPGDKKAKDAKNDEGSGGDLEKAGFMGSKPPGGAPMGAPPAGGGMPKMPKLPGAGAAAAPAAPKPAGAIPMPKAGPMSGPVPKTPKPPAMGAGSPSMKAEDKSVKFNIKPDTKSIAAVKQGVADAKQGAADLKAKLGSKGLAKDLTWDPASKPSAMPAPQFAPEPGVASLKPGVARSQNLTGKAPPNQADAVPSMMPKGPPKIPGAALGPVISSAPPPAAAKPTAGLAAPPAAARPAPPAIPGAHLTAGMGKSEFGPEHTVVGKKPKLDADPPLKPLVPQGQAPGSQLANMQSQMKAKAALKPPKK